MSKENMWEIMDMLRGRVSPEEKIHTFVMNYYLSRKLKNNSIGDILEKFKDDNIRYKLMSIYEGDYNYLDEFDSLEDLSLDEIIEYIGLLSEFAGRRSSAERTTVKSIIDLSLELLSLEKEDMLLDVGSGIGTTLLAASTKASISGIEINLENYELSCVLLDLFNVPIENIVHRDVYTYDISKFNATKVFMNMPMGIRMSGQNFERVLDLKFSNSIYRNHIRPIDSSWVFALDIIENTKYEKFVMLMNGNPLYGDVHKDVRKILVNSGKIEAVIALPSNLLAYTAIPIYLVIFSHDNEHIKFINATKLYSEVKFRNALEKEHIDRIIIGLNKDSDISKTVNHLKLLEEDFTLDPLRYLVPDFPFKESIMLKDVVKSINRGHTISKKDLDKMTSIQPTDYQYLMLQNFQNGILDSNLPYLNDLDKSYEQYFLKDNSVIISRLSPFKIGSVDKLKTKVLANGNLFFLEIDESKINKDFLSAYLQSRVGLKEIDKYVKGSTMKTISIRDLERIKIPKVSMEKQKEIGNDFILLNSEFKAIKKRTEEIIEDRMNMFEGGI